MLSTDIKSLNSTAKDNPDRAIGESLRTASNYPVYYRIITKCGCTFALNVLFHLQYGHLSADPFRVHDQPPVIPLADTTSNTDITDSPYTFIIIRDPVKRFMSLYFDKLYGKPRKSEKFGLGDYFIENHLIDPDAGRDAQKHRDNCIRSIQWIRQNLKGATDQPKNYHWKPQHFKLKQIRRFKFHVLILEDIHFQLGKTLKPLIPNINAIMNAVSVPNQSQKPVKTENVLNDELCQLISDTYRKDTIIHREVSTYWHNLKENMHG